MKQKTIKEKIFLSGMGLHSGLKININILPAAIDTGIIFKKIPENIEIPALYFNVVETQLGTVIAKNGVKISTIEHLMSAFWACDLDNLIVEIDGNEVPILDGSSKFFIETISKIETVEQEQNKRFLKILKEIKVEDGEKFIKITPSENFSIDMFVEFPYGNIGKQEFFFDGDKDNYKNDCAFARTFCNKKEIEYMQSIGFAKGGSLDNAMVFDDFNLINKDGFRVEKEVVKHKILDCVGDIFTSGYNIKGSIIASKTGHGLNNIFLKETFKNNDNYKII